LAYFNEWLEYRARHEAAFFSIDVPIEGPDYRTVRARFASAPTTTALAEDLWLCTAELETRDVNSLTPSQFAFLEAFFAVISYNDLLAMLEAVNTAQDILDEVFDLWEVITLSIELFYDNSVYACDLSPFFDAWVVFTSIPSEMPSDAQPMGLP